MIGFTAWIMSVANIVLKGFVLVVLWNWFISPVFGGPVITLIQGLGMLLTMSLITVTIKKKDCAEIWNSDPATTDDIKYEVIRAFAYLVGLGVGYIYTLFM